MLFFSIPLRAFPTRERLNKLSCQLTEFLSCRLQPVSVWRSLLGRMLSLFLLVPSSHLRMHSLQLLLNQNWDFLLETTSISWDNSCLRNLQWWSDEDHLTPGVPLESSLPDCQPYTDASNLGWGASPGEAQASGLWSPHRSSSSINIRELLVVELALISFLPLLQSQVVALFCNNVTVVSYLKKAGEMKSSSLNQCGQRILCFGEDHAIVLLPQFVAVFLNVLANVLNCSNQVLGAEWTLCQEVVSDLMQKWPATIDHFATHLNHRLPVYFSLVADPMSIGTDAMLQPWDNLEVCTFPPFGMVH